MAKKKNKYSFAKKRHSRQGIASTVFAGISLGIFCVAALCSLIFHGKGGMYLGVLGLIAIGLSVYGFIVGLKSFSKENRAYTYSKVGAIANGAVGNGVLMVIWLALFLIGIS
jgi:hypothetical protein